MKLFKNIKSYFPKDGKETRDSIYSAYNLNGPLLLA